MVALVAFVALPFHRRHDGSLLPGEAQEHSCAAAATAAASEMLPGCAGAVAFSRELDLETGLCGAAVLLHRTGELPSLDYLLGSGSR